jgi:hypothetical protein
MQMIRDDHVEKARKMFAGFGPAKRKRVISEALAFYGKGLSSPAGRIMDPDPDDLLKQTNKRENHREATVMYLAYKLARAEYKKTGYPLWKAQ